ncbi:MAG TPA: NlpC/P60 family protein [Dongiaceae bacterium]|nr:NlpC/P60 family protein [Dongiaceae bacterium]
MASLLVGTALVLVAGCQSAPRSNPPPFPAAPSAPSVPVTPPAPSATSAPAAPPQLKVTPPAQPPKALTPAAWRAEANRWLGVKYRKGGTDRTGIDCPGLTSRMYLAVAGVALPRTSQEQSRFGKPVSRKDLQAGDLIFFSSLSRHSLEHVGVYLGDTRFVHASPSKGVVVSSLLQDYYMKRYHSARRVVP